MGESEKRFWWNNSSLWCGFLVFHQNAFSLSSTLSQWCSCPRIFIKHRSFTVDYWHRAGSQSLSCSTTKTRQPHHLRSKSSPAIPSFLLGTFLSVAVHQTLLLWLQTTQQAPSPAYSSTCWKWAHRGMIRRQETTLPAHMSLRSYMILDASVKPEGVRARSWWELSLVSAYCG